MDAARTRSIGAGRTGLIIRLQLVLGFVIAGLFAYLEMMRRDRLSAGSPMDLAPALALMMLFVFLHLLLGDGVEADEERGLTLVSRGTQVRLDWSDIAARRASTGPVRTRRRGLARILIAASSLLAAGAAILLAASQIERLISVRPPAQTIATTPI